MKIKHTVTFTFELELNKDNKLISDMPKDIVEDFEDAVKSYVEDEILCQVDFNHIEDAVKMAYHDLEGYESSGISFVADYVIKNSNGAII